MAELTDIVAIRNEDDSDETANERAAIKYLQSIINNHDLSSTDSKVLSGQKRIRNLFTDYYKKKGNERLWPTDTFTKNYKYKKNMLDSILDITIHHRRPSRTRTYDSSELVFKRNISDSDVERYLRAIGVNDSTTASQSSSVEISQDSGRSTRSKRNTSKRDTMDEAGNTSSSRQPQQQQQQQHESVSISGNTVDGGSSSSSFISTDENNSSSNNYGNSIGSSATAVTKKKRKRPEQSSRKRRLARECLNSGNNNVSFMNIVNETNNEGNTNNNSNSNNSSFDDISIGVGIVGGSSDLDNSNSLSGGNLIRNRGEIYTGTSADIEIGQDDSLLGIGDTSFSSIRIKKKMKQMIPPMRTAIISKITDAINNKKNNNGPTRNKPGPFIWPFRDIIHLSRAELKKPETQQCKKILPENWFKELCRMKKIENDKIKEKSEYKIKELQRTVSRLRVNSLNKKEKMEKLLDTYQQHEYYIKRKRLALRGKVNVLSSQLKTSITVSLEADSTTQSQLLSDIAHMASVISSTSTPITPEKVDNVFSDIIPNRHKSRYLEAAMKGVQIILSLLTVFGTKLTKLRQNSNTPPFFDIIIVFFLVMSLCDTFFSGLISTSFKLIP
jgi:hypothetical protein